MKKTTLNEMLQTMATKASLCNIYKAEGKYEKNFRECPFWSELHGMITAMKIMGIEPEIEYTADVQKMLAIKANGIRVEI